MATIKSYTDLEQSKALAEFLPLESADMWWNIELDDDNEIDGYTPSFYPEPLSDSDILCWSLTALLSALDFPSLTQNKEDEWEVCVPNHTYDGYIEVSANNPVDACVEMVIKLHELNLL